MPRRTYSTEERIVTLAQVLSQDMLLRLNCYDCNHVAELDPLPLAVANGENTRLQWILERAVCKACGARYPRVDLQVTHRISPGTSAWAARNGG